MLLLCYCQRRDRCYYCVIVTGGIGVLLLCYCHQSTQFRLSAGELLLFVFMVLVLINSLYGIPNCNDLVS